jgi:predicted CXXCH cytochrome family protein
MKLKPYGLLYLAFLVFIGSQVLLAQTNDDCLMCHSDSTLTMEKGGKKISLYVNENVFKSSVHGDASCVDCHVGFDPNNIPHKKSITPVDCNSCHGISQFQDVARSKELAHFNVKCAQCHGTHDIQPVDKIVTDKKCLSCHPAEKGFLSSAHVKLETEKKGGGCESCHGKAHDVKSVTIKGMSRRPVVLMSDSLCANCHKDAIAEIDAGVHKKAFDEGIITCVSCHSAHGTQVSKELISRNACFKCHTDSKLFSGVRAANGESLTSLVMSYNHSIHSESLKRNGKGATCVDCHGSHTIKSPADQSSPVNRANIVSTCGKCHGDVENHYLNSSHGKAFKEGVTVAPVCTDCHSEHSVTSISDPNSPVSRSNEPKICLSCHLENPIVLKLTGVSPAFLESIKHSVHLVALSKGNLKAATCSDCHGAHDMLPAGDPRSSVFKNNIPNTCGKAGCHSNIASKYFDGIHGKALRSGNKDAPVCVDCHGDHQILATSNPNSMVSNANVAQVCSNCHGSVRLTERYGLPQQSVGSYLDSYHGLANKGGMTTVANCASCHGAHDIKPSSDPTSPINKANLAKTCGKCHPGADAQFAAAPVHVLPTSRKEPLLFWISQIYGVLIVSIIGLMFIHNVFDFVTKSRRKLRERRRGIAARKIVSSRLFVRMTKPELAQHWGLLISFTLLVITGFMLRFPDSWWVKTIRDIGGGGETVFELRGIVHRIAAIILVSTALFHLYYILFTQRGKQFIRDMAPKLKDAHDVVDALKFYFGISEEKPQFDRFSYVEKAEYWALIWGTVVMATTGFMLWFDNFSLGLFTKLGLDAATLIHYYEAILASLAILVWHLYFVIFNPDVYPMNLSWLVGTLTEEEMLEEHPLELERLKMIEEKESQIVVENGDEAGKGENESNV